MKTYWEYVVSYRREDGSTGSMVSSGATSDDALANAATDASYYLLACGYDDVTIEVGERCDTCHNDGIVRKTGPRSVRTIRCPECRGKIPQGHNGPFPMRLHENVRESAKACLV